MYVFLQGMQKRSKREIHQIPPKIVEFTKMRNFTKNVIITQMGHEKLNYLVGPSQGYGPGAESGGIHLKREKTNTSPIIGGIL